MLAKAILNRLKPRVEQLLRERLCGFRCSRGSADQLFSLWLLLKRAREYHHPIYACLIDFKEAYDLVNHDALWHILHYSFQLPAKLLATIRALHENSSTAVKAYGKVSGKFPVTNGVRQACVLAPALINLYLDVAIHVALDEHRSRLPS